MAKKTEAEVLNIDGKDVRVSNPAKLYFPTAGITKLELVQYYLKVGEGALRGIPEPAHRFEALRPWRGRRGSSFKNAPPRRDPEWVKTVELSFPSGRTADEIVVTELAQLVWIVNLGCIDLNPHPVRADDLDHPDELRVDLDPGPGVGWTAIREAALLVRELLEELGLVGWPKTSGSRGMHVNVRIEPRWEFGEVRRGALALAREVERRAPDLVTSKWWKGRAPWSLPRLQPECQRPDRGLGLFRPSDRGRPRIRAASLGRSSRL